MALVSLIGPLLKGLLGAKSDDLTSGDSRTCSKMLIGIFWVVAVMGGFFALSGLYEYFNSIYPPVYAKGYMAGACFFLSIGGYILYSFVKWIISFFQKPKTLPAVVNSVEHEAFDMMKVIQNEGLQLVKQHPFAAALIGITVGLLSGSSTFSRYK